MTALLSPRPHREKGGVVEREGIGGWGKEREKRLFSQQFEDRVKVKAYNCVCNMSNIS